MAGHGTPQRRAFDRLHSAFDRHGASAALIAGDRRLSFTELARLARGYARGLEGIGVRRGERVATLCDASPELVAALVGHYHAGAIHVPINTRYRAAEIAHILADADARAVFCDAAHAEELDRLPPPLRELPRIRLDAAARLRPQDRTFDALIGAPAAVGEPADDDPALIIYTSGTTGPSKGVVLPFRAVVDNIGALTEMWGWSEHDQLVLALPLFHVHGLCIGVHGALLHGMTTHLLPRFDPAAVVDAIAAGGSVFMGVPTMYRLLIDHLETHPEHARVLAGARLFTSGSAALPAADLHRFEALTGHRILERYGMSETLITLSNPLQGERRPGSVGLPVPGCELRIVGDAGQPVDDGQPGELEVRSHGIMSGYWRAPEATQASFHDGEVPHGWFRTGDVARRDADGYVHLLGRSSVDIIKSGGFKISALEIEATLAEHPDVREVAVVGLPDRKWGEKIAAAVVCAGPVPEPRDLLLALAGHVSAHLADFKKPRALIVVDALPRNALGKVQKQALLSAVARGELPVIA